MCKTFKEFNANGKLNSTLFYNDFVNNINNFNKISYLI